MNDVTHQPPIDAEVHLERYERDCSSPVAFADSRCHCGSYASASEPIT